MMQFKSLFLFACAVLFSACPSAVVKPNTPNVNLIPQPLSVKLNSGTLTIDETAYLVIDKSFLDVGDIIKSDFSKSTNINLDGNITPIKLSYSATTHDEGYRLIINEKEIAILAKTPAGAFYGYQTLKQLFPIDFFKAKNLINRITVPQLLIIDSPRFNWRGLHLDCARYFHSVEAVKHFIDIMALHKYNKFHWHLSDDQGWRLEIKKYPKLTSVGSIRSETLKGPLYKSTQFDGKPHKGFYTQQQAKEIVEYAAKRFITVVPEIELPGHTKAAIAAYPELGNSKKQLAVHTTWGVVPQVINTEDNTIAFFKDVFDEVMEIFPSTYIHIGGDECPKEEWKNSAKAQERMKMEGLKDENALQGWITNQMVNHMKANGRKVIGWDEILEGNPSKSATIMSWRDESWGIKASQLGHDVIMTPNSYTYFNHYQSSSKDEPMASNGVISLKKVYNWEPSSNLIAKQHKKHIIGAQGCVWGEYVRNIEYAIYMAYPRACALSEVLWSAPQNKNFNRFQKDLNTHLLRLAFAGFEVKLIPFSKTTINYNFSKNVATSTHFLPQSPNGLYQIFLSANSGDPIVIEGVDLFYNNKLIDSEYHYGYSGTFNQGSIYTLQTGFPTTNHEAEARIRLRTENSKEAKGKIVLITM